jgi:hypothetical protein
MSAEKPYLFGDMAITETLKRQIKNVLLSYDYCMLVLWVVLVTNQAVSPEG